MSTDPAIYVVLYRCPKHGGHAIVVEDESGSGTRVLGPKCCHEQYRKQLVRWEPSAREWDQMLDTIERAREDAYKAMSARQETDAALKEAP